jgi:hypothetical protein
MRSIECLQLRCTATQASLLHTDDYSRYNRAK